MRSRQERQAALPLRPLLPFGYGLSAIAGLLRTVLPEEVLQRCREERRAECARTGSGLLGYEP